MVPLPSKDHRDFPVLQSSAVPILKLPKMARRIKLRSPIDTRQAQEILKTTKTDGIVASMGSELAAFGRDEDLLTAFSEQGAEIEGTIELDIAEDSWALGLVYDALVRAICREQPLVPSISSHLY